MLKFTKYAMLLLIAIFIGNVGCRKPPKVDIYTEIEPHETAFVIPMEGDNVDVQAQFSSVSYLEEKKVAAKRIFIPTREVKTGRHSWNIKRIPTLMVIRVNRTPVTREWTSNASTGTSSKEDAITVESKESIGFSVGVNLTAMIREEDASKFLYYYPGRSLAEIVDTNVRGFVQTGLSREFGTRSLAEGRESKKEIFDLVNIETVNHFYEFGITITSMGLAEGLTYDNPEIQVSINQVFQSRLKIQVARNEKEEQEELNMKRVSIAIAEREAAQEFAKAAEAQSKMIQLRTQEKMAEAQLEAAKKWDGHYPDNLMPSGSAFLMGLSTESK